MLAPAHRLTSPADFREVVRRGARRGGPLLTVHLLVGEPVAPARAGLVVAKNVGPAVVRNRVKRRLRHLLRPLVAALPAGTSVVLRAHPAAAAAAFDDLRVEVERCLRECRERLAVATGAPV